MGLRGTCVVFLASILTVVSARAQERGSGDRYRLPPESVRDVFDRDKSFATLDAPSPDGDRFLVPVASELSTLDKMGRPTLRLAMMELRPEVDREWRLDTFGAHGLRIYSLSERSFVNVDVPAQALVSDAMWSPDGSRIAFLAHLPERTEIWTAEAATGRAAPVSPAPAMVTLAARPPSGRADTNPSRMLQWTPQGTLIALLVPAERGAAPERRLPGGPIVRRTRDKAAATRTLPFLLRDAHDAALFRYHTTAQLAELTPGAPPRRIGEPGMFLDVAVSPDGRSLLAERLEEPFSFLVGYEDFPRRLEVIDLADGKPIETIRRTPLREDQSPKADDPRKDLPREVAWRPGGGLAFLWREEKKEDDEDAERRDRLMVLDPPFALSGARVLGRTADGEESFRNLLHDREGRYAFVTVEWSQGKKKRQRMLVYELEGETVRERTLVPAYDPEEVTALPGELLTRRGPNGLVSAVVSRNRRTAYLLGPGYREDLTRRPFVDRIDLTSGEKERMFESASDVYERPLAALDPDLERMILQRESRTDFPDSFLWTRGGELEDLTGNRDPFPEITAARRIDFEFTRRDGLAVQGRISLPLGYQEGDRVPAVFWTYPREYSSFEDYRREAIRSRNRNAFTELSYLRWSDIWLTQGYALVHPDVPIIREEETYNDNYVQHLVDTLYAAIRRVDEMGLVDVDRIGHGGHSYGAFATANLLARTPFFKAGIAGNGAYNRTLTPMGFQRERRFLWEAPSLYYEMSPFFQVDHIDTPLLLYHGADDDNSGTFPIQSERLMQALTGLGKTAVLYLYPFESHTPRAKETYLDLWARWLEWFDRYVKSPAPPAATTEPGR